MIGFPTRLLLFLRARLKSRARLEAENLVLRQQVIVLSRKRRGRVTLRNLDRLLLVWLYRVCPVASRRDHYRQAGNGDSLAPPRLSRLLAVEVPLPWRTSPN